MPGTIGSAWIQVRPEFLSFGDEVASQVGEAGQKASESFGKNFGKGMMAVGAAATGIGGLLVKFSEPLEQANARLDTAITNTGNKTSTFSKQIDSTVSHMENYGHTADDTKNALASLTEATNSPTKALADMGVVANIAADKHISLAAASKMVAQVLAGNTRTLKQYGITTAEIGETSAQAATKLASAQKAATSADAAAATSKQKLADMLTVLTSKFTLTAAQTTALKDAQQALTAAQASGDPSKIAAAQQHLTDVMTAEAATHKLTAAQTIALKNAQDAVTTSAAKAAAAHTALAAATKEVGVAANSGQAALGLLEAKIKGSADAQAQTFGGHIAALRAHFIDMAAELGTKVGPALTLIGPPMLGIGAAIQSGIIGQVGGVITGFGSMVASAASWAAATIASVTETIAIWALYAAEAISNAASAAASWVAGLATQIAATAVWAASMIASAAVAVAGWVASMAAMVASAVAAGIAMIIPFLPVILILAAIAAAAYLLYRNWGTVWDAIKAVTNVVVGFLIQIFHDLVNLAMLPIRVELAILQTVWQAVWDTVRTILQTAWGIMLTIFQAIVNLGIHLVRDEIRGLQTIWQTTWSALQGVIQVAWSILQPIFQFIVNLGIHLVRDEIQTLQGIWQGVWSAVTGAVQSAWGTIQGIFAAIKQGVQDVINTVGTIGSAISHIPGAGVLGSAASALGLAAGGPIQAGVPTLVGEHGPEMFVAPQNGRIVPNNQLGSTLAGSAAGGGVVLNIYPAAGMDEAAIGASAAQEIAWANKGLMR